MSEQVEYIDDKCPNGCDVRVEQADFESPRKLRQLIGPIETVCPNCEATFLWPDMEQVDL